MRHLFDQYSQPENRLTHALVMGLAQDKALLRRFLRKFTNQRISARAKLQIIEQSIPGKPEEKQSEDLGLPDAWIYTDEGWCLLIESKIDAVLRFDQLKRHLKTARRRGFEKPSLLVLATERNLKRLPNGVMGVPWTDIYKWLSKQGSISIWAKQISSYMEIAEAKMLEDGYLKEGSLTKFSGIPFSRENPFTYLVAKQTLGLVMDELRQRSVLKKIGVDLQASGRKAIKAYKGWAVWDFLRLKGWDAKPNFTGHPHLTVSIHVDLAKIQITLPSAIEKSIRKKVFGLGKDEFSRLIFQVARNMRKIVRLDPAAEPYIQVLQRHYLSQNSDPKEDAVLRYDMRTVATNGLRQKQKYQPQWIEVTYDVMTHIRSNIQFEVGVIFPYRESKVINSPRAIDAFEQAVVAMKPLLKLLTKK